MLDKIRNSFAWLFITLRLFKNWPEIYRHRFFGNRNARQRLFMREGVVFEVAKKETAIPIIEEIWHQKVYVTLEDIAALPSPTVVDIGANIGSFSLFALARIPSGRVFAFEPEPKNFATLDANIRLNKMGDRCTVVNKGISGREETRTLYVTDVQSGTNSLFNQGKHVATAEIECITLADIFKQFRIERCDFLKIDCEGAEYEILMHTPAPLFRRIRKIVMEWHTVAGHTVDELESYLSSVGYTVQLNVPVSRVLTATYTEDSKPS